MKRRKARSSLLDFTLYTKPDYEVADHHRLICETLDRFVAGEIKRLMVFCPPRHGKSELVSRRLPAYIFGKRPDVSIIACSYSFDLASRMNRDVQRIIDSDRYAKLFPETRLFGRNVRAVAQEGTWLRNNDLFEIVSHAGMYRSAGVGGGITGMGFDFGIIDDPIKDQREAYSKTIREHIHEWYGSTFYTRQSDDAGILLTMTRWHPGDLAGLLLDEMEVDGDKWVVLSLPALAGENDILGREAGVALWPNRFDAERLDRTKGVLGPRKFGAMYQQNPRNRTGGMFERDWFDICDEVPAKARSVRYWDMAATEDSEATDPDWTRGCLMAKGNQDPPHYYIRHYVSLRGTPLKVENTIKQTASADKKKVRVYMEQGPADTGKAQIDHYRRNVIPRGISFDGDRVTGSKELRAEPLAAAAEDGRVHLVEGDWNLEFLDEIQDFPYGSHDDFVDGASGALNALEGLAVSIVGDGSPRQGRGTSPVQPTDPTAQHRERKERDVFAEFEKRQARMLSNRARRPRNPLDGFVPDG